MKVIIVGCGRLGIELSYRLFKAGHEVAVIDHVPQAFNRLPSDFQGRLIEGDAINQDVLLRAGIQQADALAAVTNIDALNLVVCQVADKEYHVSKVIARNYDPHSLPYYEAFNIQVVSSSSWGAHRIEDILHTDDIRVVYSAGNGEVEIYELSINENWDGATLEELVCSPDCKVVSLTRSGQATLPTAETRLQKGDLVTLSATFDGINCIREGYFNRGKEA